MTTNPKTGSGTGCNTPDPRTEIGSLPSVGPLYDELFAQPVVRLSDRYERLTAVVLAVVGGQGVRHQKIVGVPDAPGESYVMDVVVDGEDGNPVPVLVECRELSRRVERDDVLAHQAKAEDVKALPAMVTTAGYQEGAVKYAGRKGIVLIVLRRFDHEDWKRRAIKMTARLRFPVVSAELHTDDASHEALDTAGVAWPVRFEDAEEVFLGTTLRKADGTWAENGLVLLSELGADRVLGSTRIYLAEPRTMEWRRVDVTFDSVTWTVSSTPEVALPLSLPIDAPDAELLCEVVVGPPSEFSITREQLIAFEFADDGEVVAKRVVEPPEPA